jgi:hypothetical protein
MLSQYFIQPWRWQQKFEGSVEGGCYNNASIYLSAEKLALSLLPPLENYMEFTQLKQ